MPACLDTLGAKLSIFIAPLIEVTLLIPCLSQVRRNGAKYR